MLQQVKLQFRLIFRLAASLLLPLILTAYASADISITNISITNIGITKDAQNITTERQQELTYMVQQDCGSCHGMTLKGGLGPSLLPQRISVLPKPYLVNAITHGRAGTPMPPWEPLLAKQEIEWIVEQLLAGQLGQKK